MHPAPARRPRSAFQLCLAGFFLLVALVGFSTTYFFPLAKGSFAAPWVVHVHGALMFGWLLLLLTQSLLVRAGRMRAHRRLGWLGVFVATAIVLSGVAVGAFATRRDLAATGQSWPLGDLVNIVIEMLLFGVLVGLAIACRRRPEAHKRYLVLATISALGPAWFRFRHFLPFVPEPLVVFSLVADSVLLVVIARDWRVDKRVHRVYVWAGGAMFLVHALELTFRESATWIGLGRWLLDVLPV